MAIHSKTFRITGSDLEEKLKEFLHYFNQNHHLSLFPGGALYFHEDYSWLNENRMMVCFRLDYSRAGENLYFIEVIVGGAVDGLFELWGTGGSEKRRINRFQERLEAFCEKNQAGCVELEKGS